MSGFKFKADGMLNGIADYELKVRLASEIFADSAGNKMQKEAKTKAKWIDRTGNSRQTIDHYIVNSATKTDIKIRGNTPHFKYLEFAMEKRYAILWPTVKRNMDTVIKAWAKVIRK